MFSSSIDEIKNRLDIVEVIGGYLRLQKAGINYRAVCPFHSEKKPSFFVSPARQSWRCFGCNVGGSVFDFVMQIEGIEFGDALRMLAQKAGVELKTERPEQAVWRTEKKSLYEICELSCKFFEKQLEESQVGLEALKYLLKRGVTQESVKKWRLGYAPNTWQGLTDFLIKRGYKKEEIERAGMGIRGADGRSFYDRFRGRITFPVFDLHSQAIGFGARIFENPLRVSQKNEEEIAKYMNTPQTALYDKGRIVYGLDKARLDIRKKNFCILVEGYMDAIMSHQAGFENTVASSGTALTVYQLKILKRYSDNLSTAFDMDIAGDAATRRGTDLAQAEGFNIKVITMEEGKDPADIVLNNPGDWEGCVSRARSILDFYFENAFSRFDKKAPEGKKEIAKILLPVFKRIPNKIEQTHWIQKLARGLGSREEDIETELKKVSKTESGISGSSTSGLEPLIPKKTRKELLEERAISLILQKPQGADLADNYSPYFSSKMRTILIGLKKNPAVNFQEALPEHADFLDYLAFGAEIEKAEKPEEELQICLNEMEELEIKNRLDQISNEIKMAEGEKDSNRVQELIQEFNQLASKLNNCRDTLK